MPRPFPTDDADGPRRPLDQADGLRRLFAQPRGCVLPVVSNPNVAFGGVLLERLCTAFGEHGLRTLVVDAGERANPHAELAVCDLDACIEPLSTQVSFLAARGLPIRFVDSTGSTAGFLRALHEAAPDCGVLLVHAPATDLCRLFGRRAGAVPGAGGFADTRPLLLADDRPASVTHAYASMKLLAQRAGLMVCDLLLGASRQSPRCERIAQQIAACADDFLGAVLRDWVRVDPACDASEPPSPALRRLVLEQLRTAHAERPAAWASDGARPGARSGADPAAALS